MHLTEGDQRVEEGLRAVAAGVKGYVQQRLRILV